MSAEVKLVRFIIGNEGRLPGNFVVRRTFEILRQIRNKILSRNGLPGPERSVLSSYGDGLSGSENRKTENKNTFLIFNFNFNFNRFKNFISFFIQTKWTIQQYVFTFNGLFKFISNLFANRVEKNLPWPFAFLIFLKLALIKIYMLKSLCKCRLYLKM